MSSTGSGSRPTNDIINNSSSSSSNSSDSSNQEGKKLGFGKFQKHQLVGSPPPGSSSTVPGPAIGWGGHGSGRPTPAPIVPSGGSTTTARPTRPSRDGGMSNPYPESDGEQDDGEGGRSGSGCILGVGGRGEEAPEGASEADMIQRVEMAEDAYGSGGDSADDRSNGDMGAEDHQQRQDERAEGDAGGSWNQRQPDSVRSPGGIASRQHEEQEEEEEEEEEQLEEEDAEREYDQRMDHPGTPVVDRAIADDHEVTPVGTKAGGEAAQSLQTSEGVYEQDTQQHSSKLGSQSDVAFDRETQQPSPLLRPQRPELSRGDDVPGQEEEEKNVRPPQTHDSDGFQTQASPQGYSSEEGGYGDDRGPPSDDDLGLRNADGVDEVGTNDTEGRQGGLQQQQQQRPSYPSNRSQFPASYHDANREGGEHEEENERQREGEVNDPEGPQEGLHQQQLQQGPSYPLSRFPSRPSYHDINRQGGENDQEDGEGREDEMIDCEEEEARGSQGLQQHRGRHQQVQQRSESRGESATDNRAGEENAEQDADLVRLHRTAGYNGERDEEQTDAEQKRSRQGRPKRQLQDGSSTPQPQASKFGAFATGDDDGPEEEKNQGHDSGAGGASGHSDRVSDAGPTAVSGVASSVQSRFDPVMTSSRHLDSSGGQVGTVGPNSAAPSAPLIAGCQASDAQQRAKDGIMAMVEDGHGGGGRYAEEEGKGAKRKREESQAILNRKVRDSFDRITKSFLATSSALRDVEAEQNNMLRDEEKIRRRLARDLKGVTEVTRTVDEKVGATATGKGDGSDEGNLAGEPRGSKGRAAQGLLEEPVAGSAPSRIGGAPGRPVVPSCVRSATRGPDPAAAGAAAAVAAVISQQPPDGGGVGSGRGNHQSSGSRQHDASSIVAGARGSSDGNRSSSGSRPAFPLTTPGGDTVTHRSGNYDKRSLGCGGGGVNRSNGKEGSALFSRARHPQGAAARAVGGSNPGGGSTGTSGYAGYPPPSSKRPCRADYRGRVAGISRSDGRT